MIWLGLLAVAAFLVYRWATENDRKWDGTGVKVLKPAFPALGTYPMWFIHKTPIAETFKKRYQEMKKHPYYVYYFLKEDIVVVNDPELIKDICIKDFDHFVDRVVFDSVLKTHPEQRKFLTNLKGEEWKVLRNGLSPSFTAGKLRNVVEGLDTCGPAFTEYMKNELKRNEGGPLKMWDTFKRYTMGAIASSVFGVDARAFETEDSQFVRQAKSFQFKMSLTMIVKFLFIITFPKFCEKMGFRLMKKDPYFSDLTKAAMEHRRRDGGGNNDMLKLLIDLQQQDNNNSNNNSSKDEKEEEQFESDARLSGVTRRATFDEDTITQSAVLFLVAGFDTTAFSLSIVSYYLATNPDAQERARQEADDIAATLDGGKVRYDDVKRMEYIDMVVSESLRLGPIASVIERVCTKDYKLPCGAVLPKNTRVSIPTIGLHTDPRYWEDPEEFRPERFSKENKHKILHGTYLPFGLGPRNCIGMRFALMEVKIALFNLLRHFELRPSDKTPVPIRYNKDNFLTDVEGGNWLTVVPREDVLDATIAEE